MEYADIRIWDIPEHNPPIKICLELYFIWNSYLFKKQKRHMKALGISSTELLKSDVLYKREALVKFIIVR